MTNPYSMLRRLHKIFFAVHPEAFPLQCLYEGIKSYLFSVFKIQTAVLSCFLPFWLNDRSKTAESLILWAYSHFPGSTVNQRGVRLALLALSVGLAFAQAVKK